jgi:hypothetical protein
MCRGFVVERRDFHITKIRSTAALEMLHVYRRTDRAVFIGMRTRLKLFFLHLSAKVLQLASL